MKLYRSYFKRFAGRFKRDGMLAFRQIKFERVGIERLGIDKRLRAPFRRFLFDRAHFVFVDVQFKGTLGSGIAAFLFIDPYTRKIHVARFVKRNLIIN